MRDTTALPSPSFLAGPPSPLHPSLFGLDPVEIYDALPPYLPVWLKVLMIIMR
jgi:hypothetical protein